MNNAFAFMAGCALFALPFLQSGLADSHLHAPGPHMDHEARHGGTLLMVGDFHIEIVESDRTIELYVSDAERRPLRPRSADATYDGRKEGNVRWESYRLIAPKPPGYGKAEYRVVIDDAPPIVFGWRAGFARSAGRMS